MNIALAVVVDPQRSRTLVAQRPSGVHLESLWEFPGGKIEEHETAAECAVREALEETGLRVAVIEAWRPVSYAYPDRAVTLHPFLCEGDPAEPHLDRCVWIPLSEIGVLAFPDANAPILARLLALPPCGPPRQNP